MQHHVLHDSPQASLKLFSPPSDFSEFCLLCCTIKAASSLDIPLPSSTPHILLCLQVTHLLPRVASAATCIQCSIDPSPGQGDRRNHSLIIAVSRRQQRLSQHSRSALRTAIPRRSKPPPLARRSRNNAVRLGSPTLCAISNACCRYVALNNVPVEAFQRLLQQQS